MRLITGTMPKVTEGHVLEVVAYSEDLTVDGSFLKEFLEKKHSIPSGARFRSRLHSVWGDIELEWTWYEVTL